MESGGNLVAIGFSNRDGCTGAAEGLGKDVARVGAADKKEGFALGLRDKRGSQRLGNVLRGNKVDGQANGVGCAERCGTDHCDLFGELGEVVKLGATMERFYAVSARKDKPVVGS